MLQTGTIFQATDKLNRKYIYKFNGIRLDDTTSCSYINLDNLTLGSTTDVEYAWLKERTITIIPLKQNNTEETYMRKKELRNTL